MKKMFLTAVVALSTLAASAQFMVVTTYDGDQEESMDKLTANMGIGYEVIDGITIGAAKVPAATDSTDSSLDLFLRYDLGSFMEGAYAIIQAPREEASDNMKVGVGFSFNVWNALYLEPSYTMPAKSDDDGNREGSFKFGLGYRF
jgi:opacity protein-like surface antigen